MTATARASWQINKMTRRLTTRLIEDKSERIERGRDAYAHMNIDMIAAYGTPTIALATMYLISALNHRIRVRSYNEQLGHLSRLMRRILNQILLIIDPPPFFQPCSASPIHYQ